MGEKVDGSDGDGGISEKKDEGKKEEALEVRGVPLQNAREAEITTTSILSRKARHASVYEQAMQFGRGGASYGDVLSHVHY